MRTKMYMNANWCERVILPKWCDVKIFHSSAYKMKKGISRKTPRKLQHENQDSVELSLIWVNVSWGVVSCLRFQGQSNNSESKKAKKMNWKPTIVRIVFMLKTCTQVLCRSVNHFSKTIIRTSSPNLLIVSAEGKYSKLFNYMEFLKKSCQLSD